MSRTQDPVLGAVPHGVQLRPVTPDDHEAIRSFVAGLSLRSAFLRFFAAVSPPSPALLRRMCGAGNDADILLATYRGVVVGHAMASDRAGPGESLATEIGLVVADRWQNRGLGSAMFATLARRAARRGVGTLVMDVLPENGRMLATIERRCGPARFEVTPDAVTVRVPLPGALARNRERGAAA